MRRRSLIALSVLGFLSSSACLAFLWAVYRGDPADAEARLHFRRHERGFNELIQRFETDTNTVGIGYGLRKVLWRRGADGRSKEIRREGEPESDYYRLFRQLGCEKVVLGKDEIVVLFRVNGLQWLYPGGMKVFAFRSNAPALIVGSIDEHRTQYPRRYEVYLPLTNSWFLKYDAAY
jgi:hypothetical protein